MRSIVPARRKMAGTAQARLCPPYALSSIHVRVRWRIMNESKLSSAT
jgi:hypothetical protein